MKPSHATIGCVILSILLNTVISAVTGTASLLAATPVGVAVYLVIGISGPQAITGQQYDSAVHRGMAALAALAGVGVLGIGLLGDGLLASWGIGFANVLFVLFAGIVCWAAANQFAEGYSSAA
ncbi:hypothetical protein [Haloarchaeobius sp. DFWS5]|uniref:hypothetical protein n=1 Tax=Haloarchaeobius sp. DFWS5 TaxID=3446114 RepID=UPI003EBFFD01